MKNHFHKWSHNFKSHYTSQRMTHVCNLLYEKKKTLANNKGTWRFAKVSTVTGPHSLQSCALSLPLSYCFTVIPHLTGLGRRMRQSDSLPPLFPSTHFFTHISPSGVPYIPERIMKNSPSPSPSVCLFSLL